MRMNLRDKYEGLNLTPEERATIERYKDWVNEKRIATRFKRFYAAVDAKFPNLDPETRQQLAENLYSTEMSNSTQFRSDRVARRD